MSESPAAVLYDANGNPVAITLDGGVYKLESIDKIRNSSGTIIDPATEGTLSAADTKLGTIDGVLDAIKDTDGIKKITDALPAGTNVVGKTITRSGDKGTSSAADITSTPVDANTEALHVDGSKVTQPISAAALPLPSGAATEATSQAIQDRIGEVSATPTANTIQDRLKEIEATLTSIEAEDFSTETTLQSVLTKLTELDVAVDAIKDTDGIKKITDELPAGDNQLGKITVSTLDGDSAVKDGEGHPEVYVGGDALMSILEHIRRELVHIRLIQEHAFDISFRSGEDEE